VRREKRCGRWDQSGERMLVLADGRQVCGAVCSVVFGRRALTLRVEESSKHDVTWITIHITVPGILRHAMCARYRYFPIRIRIAKSRLTRAVRGVYEVISRAIQRQDILWLCESGHDWRMTCRA
jgi:hypothetical protein